MLDAAADDAVARSAAGARGSRPCVEEHEMQEATLVDAAHPVGPLAVARQMAVDAHRQRRDRPGRSLMIFAVAAVDQGVRQVPEEVDDMRLPASRKAAGSADRRPAGR